MSLVYRFRLSDREIARAWLTEYFRRPGWRAWRVIGGPITIAIGIGMFVSRDGFMRTMGVVGIALGVWYALKPFLSAWFVTNARRKLRREDVELEVTVDDEGVSIDDGKVRTALAWTEIRTAGRASSYVWFEVGRGSRGTIPMRAVDDLPALRTAFESRGKWSG